MVCSATRLALATGYEFVSPSPRPLIPHHITGNMAWLLNIVKCLEDVAIACSAAYTWVNGCEELKDTDPTTSDVTYRMKKLRNTVEAKGDSLMVSCDELARYVCESGVVASMKRQQKATKREHLQIFLTTLEETYLSSCVVRIRDFLHSAQEFQDVYSEAKKYRKSDLSVQVTYFTSGAAIICGSVMLLFGVLLLNPILPLFGILMIVGGIVYVMARKCIAPKEQFENGSVASVEGIAKKETQIINCIDLIKQQRIWLIDAKEKDVDALVISADNLSQSMRSILGIHRTWRAHSFKSSYMYYA